MANGQESLRQPTTWVSPVLAVGLLLLFAYLAIQVATTANAPPRLADPAPTTPPTTTNADSDYPPQYRGGYDPNARMLALLAIVSPLLTTIVGFFFGQRAGEAGGRVIQAQVQQEKSQIATVAATMAHRNATASELLDELTGRGLIRQ